MIRRVFSTPFRPTKELHFTNGAKDSRWGRDGLRIWIKQIMACRHIVSAVPHSVKAEAVYNTITRNVSPEIPAAVLKTHPDWRLFIDDASAAKLFGI